MKIKVLNQEDRNQIKAGEIIQNPQNVIKELIENAIDANASEIEIILEDGGKSLIKIIDDGDGMCKEDLEICDQQHTTSKFKSLDHIDMLGFRGEALFSLQNSSEIEIISRQKGEKIGYKKNSENISPCGANEGTTIVVYDLLSKIPVRKKFLKSAPQEKYYVELLLKNYALIFPNIKFSLQTDKIKIFPNSLSTEKTLSFKLQEESLEITGEILLNSKESYIFVNSRPVKDRRFIAILKEVHKTVNSHDLVGILLKIQCPYNEVDVNIHPNKSEIKFLNLIVYDKFSFLIRNTLNTPIFQQHNYSRSSSTPQYFHRSQSPNNLPSSSLNYFDVFNSIKNLNSPQETQSIQEETQEIHFGKEADQEEFSSNSSLGIPIAQIFTRYILTKNVENMYLIDQHAAAERITTEKLKTQKIQLQKLLDPISIDLPLIKNMEKKFTQLEKFITFHIMENKMLIKEIPDFLTEKYVEEFMIKFINTEWNDIYNLIGGFLSEKGCKNSIKSGQSMSINEMEIFIRNLEKTKGGQFCNHGRPTYVKLEKFILDKLFHRY